MRFAAIVILSGLTLGSLVRHPNSVHCDFAIR